MTLNELIMQLEKLRNDCPECGKTEVFIVDSDSGGWLPLAEISADTIHDQDGVLLYDSEYW